MEKGINVKDMTLEALGDFFQSIGEKRFRAVQVFQWIYRGVEDFREMRNLPRPLIKKLEEEAVLQKLELLKVQVSKTDGTRKYLFQLPNGNTVESVFMVYRYGNSVCISSQAGCRMGCGFCASALGGLKGNLTPSELSDQILSIKRDTGEKINHIVIMGTGEPLDNYDHLKKFLQIVHTKEGLNLGWRKITLSTCGLIPKMKSFFEDFPQVNLAISLHASNDEVRNQIMPINKRYPMGDLLAVCKEYEEKTNRRITFEYALIKGLNDRLFHAEELASKVKGLLCHVNLIPLNPVSETGFSGSDRKQAELFMKTLEKRGIQTTIRRELGEDIDGACGQLRLGFRD